MHAVLQFKKIAIKTAYEKYFAWTVFKVFLPRKFDIKRDWSSLMLCFHVVPTRFCILHQINTVFNFKYNSYLCLM